MNKAQAKEKISKLLALAQSDNANEASAALLAARRLMARYKLDEKDLEKGSAKELRTVYYTEATYSGIRNSWFIELAAVIANHHCCASVRNRNNIKSTVGTIGFVGLNDDPDIACAIFSYAVDHVRRWGASKKEQIFTRTHDKIRTNAIVKDYIYNYAQGFASGLQQQYIEQDSAESKETALVLVRPVEVTNYISGLRSAKLNMKSVAYNADAQAQGYTDGYKFNPTKQIEKR